MSAAAAYDAAPKAVHVAENNSHYFLGVFGTATIAVHAGTGNVVALSLYSATEIHPQLIASHAAKIRTEMVNSSVSMLVDFAWRYYWLVPVLADQLSQCGERETSAWANASNAAERAALPDFYLPVQSLCRLVADHFAAADPAVVTGPGAFWYD